MPDLTRLYPDRELDVVAYAATRRSSGAGSIDYASIGGYFAIMVSDGLQDALRIGRRSFDKIVDFLVDNTQVDRAFINGLGRQWSPYWGSEVWNRTIVPKGYINRFDAAADTVTLLIGFALCRFVLGKVGVSGIAKFAGGQYGSYKQRAYRSELLNALENIEQDVDTLNGNGRLTKLQDARIDASFDTVYALAKAFSTNSHQELNHILFDLKQREESSGLSL